MEEALTPDYFFIDILISKLNLLLFNDTGEWLLNFRSDCYRALKNSVGLDLSDSRSLFEYNEAVRNLERILSDEIFFNFIKEGIGDHDYTDNEIKDIIGDINIKQWISTIEFDDYVLMLAFLQYDNHVYLTLDQEIEFMVNVYLTIRHNVC
jgi:hypothetical protein